MGSDVSSLQIWWLLSTRNRSVAESLLLSQTLNDPNIIARLDGWKTPSSELIKKVHAT